MAKATGRKISGIYIPVQLDTSQYMDDLRGMKNELASVISSVQSSFNKTLDTTKLSKNVIDINKAFGQLRDSANAFANIKSGNFTKDLEKLSPILSKISTEFGITAETQKKFIEQASKTQVINAEVSALTSLKNILGVTNQEFKELAQSANLKVSSEAWSKFAPDEALVRVQKLTEEYRKLTALTGTASTSSGQKLFIDTKNIEQAVNAFKQLNSTQKLTESNYLQIAKATNTSTEAVRKFVTESEKAAKSSRNLLVAAFTPSNITAGIQSSASALGVVGGAYGMTELVKSAYNATRQMENLELSFQSVFKSSDEAAVHMEYVSQVADKLGLSFLTTAAGAKKLFAAAQGTVLQEDADEIFEAFSTMSAALKLTGAETESVFLAVSQMISKGKVSAEELRLQLAERMPGAVNLFAKSIGVTTAELDAMLQKGQVGLEELVKFSQAVQATYQQGAEGASSGLQAELARLGNEWLKLKTSFVDSDWSADVLRFLRSFLEVVREIAPAISALVSGIATLGVSILAAMAVGKLTTLFQTFAIALNTVRKAAMGSAFEMGALQAKMGSLATSSKGALASFAGWKVLLGGALLYGLYEFITAQSEAEKLFEELSVSAKVFSGDMDGVKNATEGATIALENLRVTQAKENFEQAIKDIDIVLSTIQPMINSALSGVDEQFLQAFGLGNVVGMFEGNTRTLAYQASGMGEAFLKSLNESLQAGASQEEIDDIFETYLEGMSTFLKSLSENEAISPETFKSIQEAANITYQLGMNALHASDAFSEMDDKIKALSQATGATEQQEKELASFIEKYNSSITSVMEGTKNLASAKEQSQKQVNLQLMDEISYLLKNKEMYEMMGDTATKEMQAVNNIIKVLPEYLRENNISLNEFTQKLHEAGMASDGIERLVTLFKELTNIDISSSISDLTSQIQADTAMIGATSYDKKLLETLSKQGVDTSNTELIQAIKDRDKGAIETTGNFQFEIGVWEDYQQAVQNSEKALKAFNDSKKTGSSSTKTGDSDIAKAIKELQGYKDSIQESNLYLSESESFYRDAMSNISEYSNIVKTGMGSDEEKAMLMALIVQYQAVAVARKQAMDSEEMKEYMDEWKNVSENLNLENMNLTLSPDKASLANISLNAKNQIKELTELRDNLLMLGADADVVSHQYRNLVNLIEENASLESMQYSYRMIDQMRSQLGDYYDEFDNRARLTSEIFVDGMRTAADAVGEFAASGLSDFDSFADAMEQMARDLVSNLANMFSNQIFSGLGELVSGGGSSGGSFLGSIGSAIAGIFGFAKGGAFEGASGLSNYSGSVVTSPTFFSYGSSARKFAKGSAFLGQMGEAGAEAIMPLTRTSSGHLGVRAIGSGGGSEINQEIIVNVHNNVGAEVETRQSTDNQGNTKIDVLIDRQTAQALRRPGSATSRAMGSTYNAKTTLANR